MAALVGVVKVTTLGHGGKGVQVPIDKVVNIVEISATRHEVVLLGGEAIGVSPTDATKIVTAINAKTDGQFPPIPPITVQATPAG